MAQLPYLFYFWTVMREGSLTVASSRLTAFPIFVQAQWGGLEEALGGKLFHWAGWLPLSR